MAKRKNVLNAALKALLAGVETSAWVKIPSAFIAEIASLPDQKQKTLADAPPEKLDQLLTQAQLATSNAALAAVGAQQIKALLSNLTELSSDQFRALTKLTQQQYEHTLNKLDAIHDDTKEIKKDVKKILKKVDQAPIPDTPPPKKSPIHNIPYESLGPLFKGRTDDLNLLIDQLEKQSQTTAITQKMGTGSTQLSASTCLSPFSSAISGLGGIGKTRLAVEFAWYGLHQVSYKNFFLLNFRQYFTVKNVSDLFSSPSGPQIFYPENIT